MKRKTTEQVTLNPERRGFMKKATAALFSAALVMGVSSLAPINQAYAVEDLEKEDLKFGFIKLTDMAPLAIAYEKGSG